MLEVLIVFSLVAGLVLLGGAGTLLSVETLLTLGLVCVALGTLVGFPAGFYYHVVLFRALRAHGGAPPGWYWHPTRYHAQLSALEFVRVRPWFLLGAAGFAAIVVGCLIIAAGVMVA